MIDNRWPRSRLKLRLWLAGIAVAVVFLPAGGDFVRAIKLGQFGDVFAGLVIIAVIGFVAFVAWDLLVFTLVLAHKASRLMKEAWKEAGKKSKGDHVEP